MTVAMFSFFVIIIESAGHIKVLSKSFSAVRTFEEAIYVKNATMTVTQVFNIFAFFWFTLFIFSCQDFIIAGTISKWFFSRVKNNVSCPMSTTFHNLCRYHIGSVCFGSFIVAVVKMIKSVIEDSEVKSWH